MFRSGTFSEQCVGYCIAIAEGCISLRKISQNEGLDQRAVQMHGSYVDRDLLYLFNIDILLIYQFKGNLTAARAKAVAAGELKPDWPGPISRLAIIQIEEGDIPGVQKTLEKWQKLFPPATNGKKSPKDDDLKIRYDFLVAKMNAAMGNFQASIRLFQRVSEGIPIPHRSIDVRRELAEAYFATGQPDRAREILAQILEINPRHVASLILAAKIAASLSKNEEARGYLARCDDVLKQADQRTPQNREVAHLRKQVN